MNKLNYGLDLQLFAEPAPDDDSKPDDDPNSAGTTIDYEKLAEVIEKRTARTEELALKGILKEQGLSTEELNSAVKAYKNSKALKEKEEQQKINDILEENKKYKQAEIQRSINEKAKEIAKEAGVREDRVASLLKLCDSKKFINNKGVIDEKGMKDEIEEQLKAVPEFKSGRQVKISAGAGSQTPSSQTDEDEYFKKKYGKSKYYNG